MRTGCPHCLENFTHVRQTEHGTYVLCNGCGTVGKCGTGKNGEAVLVQFYYPWMSAPVSLFPTKNTIEMINHAEPTP